MPKTISLANLIHEANVAITHDNVIAEGVQVTGVSDDSRFVEPGNVFVAREPEHAISQQHAQQAIKRGAAAVLVAEEVNIPLADDALPVLKHPNPARALGPLVHAFHEHPSRQLACLGITGTNGKTTTAAIMKQILDSAGVPCGLLGTIEIDDGRDVKPAELTTPGAVELSGILNRMVEHGCSAVAMEVSSHALEQGRVAGMEFAAGVFTNLSGDHLDYHGSMEMYAQAKAQLFTSLSSNAVAVVNACDISSRVMVDGFKGESIGVCVGKHDPLLPTTHVVRVVIESVDIDGMTLGFQTPWGDSEARVALVGDHNAFNVGCAVAVAVGMQADTSIRFESAMKSLPSVRAPRGRLEPVHSDDDDIHVFVDYAHTDDAIVNVLRAVRPVVPATGRLVVVFGAGGDRDRTKRSRMAVAACEGADVVMVTSDNPRTEDPEKIVEEILAGVPVQHRDRVEYAVDRSEAIHQSIRSSQPSDVIIIAGKGHEDYQIIGHTKHHFDDLEIAQDALRLRAQGSNGGHV